MNNIASPQGHYARIRQRFLSAGIDGLLDYEVVELLLKLANNRRDQKITRKLKEPFVKPLMCRFTIILSSPEMNIPVWQMREWFN